MKTMATKVQLQAHSHKLSDAACICPERLTAPDGRVFDMQTWSPSIDYESDVVRFNAVLVVDPKTVDVDSITARFKQEEDNGTT